LLVFSGGGFWGGVDPGPRGPHRVAMLLLSVVVEPRIRGSPGPWGGGGTC